jgi:hypothetical protein
MCHFCDGPTGEQVRVVPPGVRHGEKQAKLCNACAHAYDGGYERGYQVRYNELLESERWRRFAFELLEPFARTCEDIERCRPVHFTESQLRAARDLLVAFDTNQRLK